MPGGGWQEHRRAWTLRGARESIGRDASPGRAYTRVFLSDDPEETEARKWRFRIERGK